MWDSSRQKILISAKAVLLISPQDKQPHFTFLLYSFPTAGSKHEIAFYTRLTLILIHFHKFSYMPSYHHNLQSTMFCNLEIAHCSGCSRTWAPFLENSRQCSKHKSFDSQNLFVSGCSQTGCCLECAPHTNFSLKPAKSLNLTTTSETDAKKNPVCNSFIVSGHNLIKVCI